MKLEMLEFILIMLMAAAKCVAFVFLFTAGVHFAGYLFRKGWDAAGEKKQKGEAK